jgi:biotin synthase
MRSSFLAALTSAAIRTRPWQAAGVCNSAGMTATPLTATGLATTDILDDARQQVLERGEALTYEQLVAVLQTSDDQLQELLTLAHDVRMKWCGPDVEIEGIVSLKTGGCPEDCHFCGQSGHFMSPVRSTWLNVPEMVEAARQTRETGATKFCIVAAVRGPDEQLMTQIREGVTAVKAAVDIQVHASLGMVTQEQINDLRDMGVSRYNHNLEAARSYFPQVVTTHSYQERWDTCLMIKESGVELCCGGLVGMGETLEQRAELAAQLGELGPHEVPLNFLNPRPGTPFGDLEIMPANDALRTIAAFRLAMPRTILRYAGGRELTLGDLGTRAGFLGGINALIVGNYLTTLGRDPKQDLALLEDLKMPITALNETI